MIVLAEFVDVLKGAAAALSILFSGRKLYRLARRKIKQRKRKPTAKG
ncbi:hypothetical protein QWJ34_08720 [Saccharibacillus sp. CPCC 101409]|nr:hypothetical protein [Saccharibacillus sp. CPCC 101409]MDO3409845.1 hypothetical protein [Saccharibacillus sp. CPCC 101409]